jgi:hypothetical protein
VNNPCADTAFKRFVFALLGAFNFKTAAPYLQYAFPFFDVSTVLPPQPSPYRVFYDCARNFLFIRRRPAAKHAGWK